MQLYGSLIIIIIIIRNLYSAIMPLGGYRGAEKAVHNIFRETLDSTKGIVCPMHYDSIVRSPTGVFRAWE